MVNTTETEFKCVEANLRPGQKLFSQIMHNVE